MQPPGRLPYSMSVDMASPKKLDHGPPHLRGSPRRCHITVLCRTGGHLLLAGLDDHMTDEEPAEGNHHPLAQRYARAVTTIPTGTQVLRCPRPRSRTGSQAASISTAITGRPPT